MVPLEREEGPRESKRVFIHGLTYRIEMRSPDVWWIAEVQSGVEVPLVEWIDAIRIETLRMLDRREK